MSDKKPTPEKKKDNSPLVNCTVIKHMAKIRCMICAKGKKLTLPADEVKALVDLGLVEAG